MAILDLQEPSGIGPDTPNYDPTKPVYAEPADSFQTVGIEQKPPTDYVDPETATVEGRVNSLMRSGNPLLEAAKTQSNLDFQSRGLLNSARGVEGGVMAMLNKATDIATPDAALYGSMSQMTQKGDLDAATNNQVASLENNRNKMNARLSAALQDLDFQGNVETQKLVDTAQLQRVEIDNKWKAAINYEQLSSQQRVGMLNVAQGLGQELTGGIERILRDTNIADKTSAITALMSSYESQMITSANIAGLELSWA